MESTQQKLLVSVSDTAKLLDLSRPTVYSLINSGKIRTVRIGKRVLVDLERLKESIASGQIAG